jgi:hypothetical protein
MSDETETEGEELIPNPVENVKTRITNYVEYEKSR